MVEHATKEEATPSYTHGGKCADKAFKKKIPRVATQTKIVSVYWNYLEG